MKNIYDIHCHIFNKDVVIRRLVNIVQSLLTIKDLLDSEISEENLKYKIDLVNKTLSEVSKDSSEEVFQALDLVYQGKVTITPLMFDLTYADDNDGNDNKNKRYRKRIKRILWLLSAAVIPYIRGKVNRKFKNPEMANVIEDIRIKVVEFNKNFEKKPEKEVEIFDNANYEQQIADLEFLSEKYTIIKPFFSIDPRREYKGGINLLSLLKEKAGSQNAKFSGVKIYAPAGFSPTDPVLMGTESQQGIYSYCQDNKIPITVHNSNAGFACLSTILMVRGHVNLNNAVVEIKKPITFENKFFSLKASEAIAERARILNHPKLWKLVLQKFPNLKINFAHFGGSGQIMEYVNYTISRKSIDTELFDDSLLHLPDADKDVISKAYKESRKKMILKENLTTAERAKVWNAMYRAGLIENWSKAIFDIIKNPSYPNAFTDLSCFSQGILISLPENQELTFSIKEELKTFKRSFFDKISAYEKSKILYGSDFFLTQFFGPAMKQYFADFKEAFGNDFEIIAGDNPHRFLFG